MARTVVGLFKNQEAAHHVKKHLIGEGYSAENIRILAAPAHALPGTSTATGEKSSESGFLKTIGDFFQSFTGSDPDDEKHYTEGVRTGGALLSVTVPDERADTVGELLERHGATNVDEQKATIGTDTHASATTGAAKGVQKLDVVQEELQVGKRQVQRGGVRIYSHVVERPVEQDITLREEHVRVERHPVDRPASAADFTAFQEGTVEVTATAEEAVWAKKARVVEEVVVSKAASQRQETVKDTVRRTDVKVEKIETEKQEKL